VSLETIQEIADRVYNELMATHEREVSYREIGERVMNELRALDKVAYIRYASIYRQVRRAGRISARDQETGKTT
jgi:transcriptional repressor NrdR